MESSGSIRIAGENGLGMQVCNSVMVNYVADKLFNVQDIIVPA